MNISSTDAFLARLAEFPRITYAHLPTPLEYLGNLTKALQGPRIWVKRDDCTGISSGGNKARKLEFLIAQALAEGADTIITIGATQSNHCRQTAAFACKSGLDCHLLLEDRTGFTSAQYLHSGNVLLDQLHGAVIHRIQRNSCEVDQVMDDVTSKLMSGGKKPFQIPGGGSSPCGALGYVNAVVELLEQANEIDLRIDHLLHATGSCGTQAGLITGLAGLRSSVKLLGIGVRVDQASQEAAVHNLALETASLLGYENLIDRNHVHANCNYIGQGYGQVTDGGLEAIEMLARLEGILLDPVYTGKAMAGLIDLIRQGYFRKSDNVVFLHTGGSAALFGYTDMLKHRFADACSD